MAITLPDQQSFYGTHYWARLDVRLRRVEKGLPSFCRTGGRESSARMTASRATRLVAALLCFLASCTLRARSQILNPPYFNLAEGRNISATATCGDQGTPELYCKLVGANLDKQDNPNINLIQGQVRLSSSTDCAKCVTTAMTLGVTIRRTSSRATTRSTKRREHPARYAIDGTERWWQSPPLSRGTRFNEVNLTVDLGQEGGAPAGDSLPRHKESTASGNSSIAGTSPPRLWWRGLGCVRAAANARGGTWERQTGTYLEFLYMCWSA
ncbi:hypothetical protein HPB51_026012 [Rhipicephalus microplus]|uniref:Laminin N-terminal domain-containing protein n=1 Tax=Rhipicephalus microplus TaxID=6941 RepID=A0A9J6EE22_RHIMP|nr:hypothetical protein HPB51_026012 [Rhipicephalus microplus]